jgi:hypothetical protein
LTNVEVLEAPALCHFQREHLISRRRVSSLPMCLDQRGSLPR